VAPERYRRGVHINAIHFCPMFYRFIIDKRNHLFDLVLLQEKKFLYCLDQILVHLLAVLEMARSLVVIGP
jgi:hypothetical protein